MLNFLDTIEKRFGVYLDTIHGFNLNVIWMYDIQRQNSKMTNLTLNQLDQRSLIRGNGPPSHDLAECKKQEKHRMTQGEFKKNNTTGGLNHRTCLADCIAAFFNNWTTFKKDVLKTNTTEDSKIPALGYLKKIRDRVTHTDKDSGKRPIEPLKLKCTNYVLPGFTAHQIVELSNEDLNAIVIELREFILDQAK